MIVEDRVTGNFLESDNEIVTDGWKTNSDRFILIDSDKFPTPTQEDTQEIENEEDTQEIENEEDTQDQPDEFNDESDKLNSEPSKQPQATRRLRSRSSLSS